MKKIKLLSISPYSGMNEILQELVNDMEDVYLECYVADLEDAINLVNHLHTEAFDAIISRGGTATLLKEHTQTLVIDSGISSLDVLCAIKLAKNFSDVFSIVGFENITRHAKLLVELMDHPIPVYTIENAEESESKLLELKNMGIYFIVCDTVTSNIANKLGLCSILITSGYESLQKALEQAIYSAKRYLIYKNDFLLMTMAFQNNPLKCLIFTEDGKLLHSSLKAGVNEQKITNYLQNNFAILNSYDNESMEKKINNIFFKLNIRHIFIQNSSYTIMYIDIISAPQKTKYIPGFNIMSKDEISEMDMSYYISSHSIGNTMELLTKYAKSNSAVAILGENGTGKDKAANYIYSNTKGNQKFYYIFDCNIISEKDWNFLIESENSPLADNGHTIYFKHITSLDKKRFYKLIHYITDTNLSKRNRLLFSLAVSTEQNAYEQIHKLQQATSCIILRFPTLRERKDDIPRLCSLYINRLNLSMGKQIMGCEPKALNALQSFSWYGNLDQLKRVIRELMILTTNSYISYEHTMFILRQETPIKRSTDIESLNQLDLNKPLEQINYDIINLILSQENGNHTNTAKRLGIARSTLWRILKSNNSI